jgi:hypothetical protein
MGGVLGEEIRQMSEMKRYPCSWPERAAGVIQAAVTQCASIRSWAYEESIGVSAQQRLRRINAAAALRAAKMASKKREIGH